MMITDLGYMFVYYSEDLQLLRTQWKPGHSLQYLKEGLLYILEVAQQRGVSRIVLDLHHMPDIGVMEQAWISLTWFPKMVALPLQQAALILPSRSLYNQMVVESILWLGRSHIHFDIQFFSEMEEALVWITADSPLLPACQQEWEMASNRLMTL